MTGQGGLRIQLLGELAILRHGAGAISLPASRKTRALLGYIAATGQSHRREHLCDLLWDGPDDPRAELRWSLSKIRAVLGEGMSGDLQTDREHVALKPGTSEVDLTVLRQLLAGGTGAASTQALKAAVGMFRGEFLDGLELPGCYRFHEWCLTEREAVSALRLAALGKLVERLSNDAPEEALVQARALIGADPLSEVGHAAVVGLLGRLGRRRDALEHHDRTRRLLEAELLAPLTGELECARRTLGPAAAIAVTRGPSARPAEQPTLLRMGATDPIIPGRGALPFVGREAERAILADLVSAVGAGQVCRVLLVEGEPGIGKSRLLADLAERVTCAGGRALGARSFEAEAAVRAYGIWIDALSAVPDEEVPEDLRSDLAVLRPRLGPSPAGSGDRTRLFDTVAELLRRLAVQCPTALILDDVQWIDEASAALLHYVVRVAGPASPLMFACAARSGELEDNAAAARVARTLGREGRLLMLSLGPLCGFRRKSATVSDLMSAGDSEMKSAIPI